MAKLFKSGVLFIFIVVALSQQASGQSSSFSYQGVLSSGGVAANGLFDMQCTLYGTISEWNQIGPTVELDDVNVTNGIFSIILDFGASAFDGGERYLMIAVRAGNSTGNYTLLSPRTRISSTPYAVMSLKSASAATLSSTLPVTSGGTGSTTASGARTSLGAAASGVNTDITALNGLTTPLSVGQGGTGITVGPVSGNQFLRSAGTSWAIGPIAVSDLPNLSGSYVDLAGNQTISGDKTFTGNLTASGIMKWQVITDNQQAAANRGYIVDSANPVTITLPTNPNIGDVIRIKGLGTGGWILASGTGQSVIDNLDNLKLINWTPRESNREWTSVASSADGTKHVAVVFGGQIYTLTDAGVTWIARESNRNWYGVASSADGTKLVAVVQSGQIYTSTDAGVTWIARENNRQWLGVASSADGTKLVAVVQSGQIYTSTDAGVTWTARENNRQWHGVASSADGTKLVATVNGGQIYTNNFLIGSLNGNSGSSIEIVFVGGGRFLIVSANGSFSNI